MPEIKRIPFTLRDNDWYSSVLFSRYALRLCANGVARQVELPDDLTQMEVVLYDEPGPNRFFVGTTPWGYITKISHNSKHRGWEIYMSTQCGIDLLMEKLGRMHAWAEIEY
jgi:hypothetical protein